MKIKIKKKTFKHNKKMNNQILRLMKKSRIIKLNRKILNRYILNQKINRKILNHYLEIILCQKINRIILNYYFEIILCKLNKIDKGAIVKIYN